MKFFIWLFFQAVGCCGDEKPSGHRWNDCYHALTKETQKRELIPCRSLIFFLTFLPACSLTLVPFFFSFPAGKNCIYWTLGVHFSRAKGLTEISFWDTSGIRHVYMMCILPWCLSKYGYFKRVESNPAGVLMFSNPSYWTGVQPRSTTSWPVNIVLQFVHTKSWEKQ